MDYWLWGCGGAGGGGRRVSVMDTPPVAVRGTGTVRDNWWAIYAGGRLVSIGVWLPPPVEGIEAVRLDEDEAAALLRTLAEQARG